MPWPIHDMHMPDANFSEPTHLSAHPQRELTEKLRVFLHGKPLFDLKRAQGLRDEAVRHYDTLVLALRIWDLIVDNTGLHSEVDRDAAAAALECIDEFVRAL